MRCLLFRLVGGFLTRQVVPANNSCLFTSVNFALENRNKLDLESAGPMRQIIADVVMNDQETYNEAYLERSNAEYCKWILNEASWGGAIEVAILSAYYKVEMAVVDAISGTIRRFGEDKNYSERILLIYDGVHYDPLVLQPVNESERVCSKFATSNQTVLAQAQELGVEAKASHQFTDVSKFTIKCLICQVTFKGQAEAQAHAQQTSHVSFGEVS